MSHSPRLDYYQALLEPIEPINAKGAVDQVIGLIIQGRGPAAAIGDVCDIYPRLSETPIKAEVVGFKGHHVLLMPLGDMHGLHPDSLIVNRGEQAVVLVHPDLRGRVLDGLGQPLDQYGALTKGQAMPLYADPLNPLSKSRITTPLDLGVRAINGLLTCGKGQRLGIFAGSGVARGGVAPHRRRDRVRGLALRTVGNCPAWWGPDRGLDIFGGRKLRPRGRPHAN